MQCAMKCVLLLFFSMFSAVESRTGSPVEKVVILLKELQDRIEQDGENEQKIYDKYACWCDISMKKKADAIDQARKDLRALSQEILKLRGTIATLASEIQELADMIAENEKLQADATALREKENAAYMAETTEMKQALAALQDAITVLIEGSTLVQKGSATALFQRARGGAAVSAETSAKAVKKALDVMPMTAKMSEKQLSALTAFVQDHSSGKYAPQSLTIQGILKDMYDTFSTDLEESTLVEATNNREYELFIKTKEAEKAAMQQAKKLREEQKADAEQALAEATAMYDETYATKESDEEFFDATKESCLAKKAEMDTRVAARTEELEGISKALEILTSDSARELFASAIKPGKETGASAKYDTEAVALSFMQLDGDATAPRAKAYALLKRQATKAHSIRLAQLAAQVHEAKVGHFDAVIKAIDEMLKALMEENVADIAKRDQCKAEYQDTEATSKQLKWEIEKNQAKIDKLESIIAEHEAEKEATIKHIAETQEAIAVMTKEREESNAAFLAAKDEDLKAIDLLHQAKTVLLAFYKAHEIEMGKIEAGVKEMTLVQKEEPEGVEVPKNKQGPDFEVSQWQAPEAELSNKGGRAGETKDITSILTMLIEDLNDEIRNSMKAEEEAQLAYEKAKAAAEKLIEELTAKKVSLEEAIAERTVEKTEEKATKATNEALLKDELDYRAKITPDCDWIIGAFSKREARRDAEEEGLRGAKDFLAGAQEAAFLQKGNRRPAADFASLKFMRVN